MAKPSIDPASRRDDLSEWQDGPALFALTGGDASTNQYRLGSRDYDWHAHVRGQVLCVETGLIEIRTSRGAWLLPPHRAAWIPPRVSHQVRVTGATLGWSLLIAPAASDSLPAAPCIIGVSEVLRALVRRAETWSDIGLTVEQERMAAVIIDEIRHAPLEPLHLPMPSDARLRKIAHAVASNPASTRTLAQWGSWGGMSPRSLSRLILAETGLSFGQWRQQARLNQALEMLARGLSVAQVADRLGYASPSSFILMFRQALGDSPGHYFRQNASVHIPASS